MGCTFVPGVQYIIVRALLLILLLLLLLHGIQLADINCTHDDKEWLMII